MDSIGVTEAQGWHVDIRESMNRSPAFIRDVLIPLAEQQGKLDDLLKQFDPATHTGKYPWMADVNLRPAVEIGILTGNWQKLNDVWKESWYRAGSIEQRLPGLMDKLAIGESVLKPWQQFVKDLHDFQEAIKATMRPADDMLSKFLRTGEITASLAGHIRNLGGDLRRFQEIASLQMDLGGLNESLAFIQRLSQSVRGLAPQLDPINQIMSGQIGPEGLAALTNAGLDPEKLTDLMDMIRGQQAIASWQAFNPLSDSLIEAIERWGGDLGRHILEEYRGDPVYGGVSHITDDFLKQLSGAIQADYMYVIKDALAYLEEAERQTKSEIEQVIDSIDAAKQAIVDEIDRLIEAVITRQYDPNAYYFPDAPVRIESERAATQTQPPQAVQQTVIHIENVYGYDDFAQAVRAAGFTLAATGAE